ncbi:Outer membrane protein assembly factor BamA [Alphaproteobacteria bacterium SO-S41]|nr:Outer membrane protein assembly factor BamA [Alphaproteobacteria bacterium SO-S41]
MIFPAALSLIAALSFPFFGGDEEKQPEKPPEPVDTQALAYDVTLIGPDDPDLAERIRGDLELEKKKERGTPSVGVLESRMEKDLERARHALQAYGYYDGTATGAITQDTRLHATIRVEQGLLYRIGVFAVTWQGARPAYTPQTVGEGLPATGLNIVAAGERIVAELKTLGYFDARMVERRAVLDRGAGKVDVTLIVDPGNVVSVGGFKVSGAETIPEARVVRLSKLEIGELLTPPRLQEAEDKLMESGIFNEARVSAIGVAPARLIGLTVTERLPRSISGAIKWSLQDGYAIEAAWEHRNIFGDAEKLRAAITVGSLTQSLDVSYREYDVLFDNHTLVASLNVAHEDVDGLVYEQAALIGTLETDIYKGVILRYGGSIEYVHDETQLEGGDFALVGLRVEATYDGANDLFDPTEGFRASVRIGPYIGWNGDLRNFTILEAVGSAYLPLDEEKTWVLAGRLRLGSIVGDGRDDIPLPKRFFAGGGGSIRGYSYKRAGPIDADDRPIGGASVVEFNGEVRWRINEDFGAAVFVDAGGAFESNIPGQGGDWFIGAGAGVRYYSPIGPVRLDVAAPINARSGEPGVQIYVSIGQAF